MTQIDRDELEELIRRVIAEERQESMAHPARREKVTRYTDPDGKTWVSMTMERAEIAQKLIGLAIALCTLLSLVNYAIITYAVRPEIRDQIDNAIAEHELSARTRMNEMLPSIVNRAEWSSWTAEKNEKWRAQDLMNEAMNARLVRIEEKLDRLIERR